MRAANFTSHDRTKSLIAKRYPNGEDGFQVAAEDQEVAMNDQTTYLAWHHQGGNAGSPAISGWLPPAHPDPEGPPAPQQQI